MVIELIAELYPEALKMDGFDDCIIGVCHRFGFDPLIAYDRDKVVDKLVSQGMTQEQAVEFYEFNHLGAYMGDHTPVFIEVLAAETSTEDEA